MSLEFQKTRNETALAKRSGSANCRFSAGGLGFGQEKSKICGSRIQREAEKATGKPKRDPGSPGAPNLAPLPLALLALTHGAQAPNSSGRAEQVCFQPNSANRVVLGGRLLLAPGSQASSPSFCLRRASRLL